MGILDKATNASDYNAEYVKMFVYGPPGTGKTYLAKTASDAGQSTLLLDAESGCMTIRDSSVRILSVSIGDMREIYSELAQGSHGYQTLVLDSLTELQKKKVDDVEQKGRKGMTLQKWGEVITWTRKLVRSLRDLPMNVIVLCLSKEQEEDDGDQKRLRIRPDVHGSTLPLELAGFFDVVGYAHTRPQKEGIRHAIAFKSPGGRIITKDRSGLLEAIMPNDFGHIYNTIMERTDDAS